MNIYRKIRKTLHKLASIMIGGVYKALAKIGIFHPKVVVYMDGGICSQMQQFMIGKIYAMRGEDVYYDLKWFKDCGLDVDGKYKRIYELEEAFPYLKVNKIVGIERWFYRMFLCNVSKDMRLPQICNSENIAPIYLGGYYAIPHKDFKNLFQKLYVVPNNIIVSDENSVVKCAVHIRRGDLAQGDNIFYGGCSDSYFFNAIDYVVQNYSNVKFFFFSDEMDYVINNIVPQISDKAYEIVHSNKAFEDVLKMSNCDVIIASQGTFGKFAAMFSNNTVLILKDESNDPYRNYRVDWSLRKEKIIYIKE